MRNITDIINEANPVVINYENNIIIDKLKEAFAEEMNAWYQYYIIAPFLQGKLKSKVAADYKENGDEELKHATMLLKRIQEINGTWTDIDTPDTWNNIAPHKYILQESPEVEVSVELMAKAEMGAIETYTTLLELTKEDKATNNIIKSILADEQKHLEEMNKFLKELK